MNAPEADPTLPEATVADAASDTPAEKPKRRRAPRKVAVEGEALEPAPAVHVAPSPEALFASKKEAAQEPADSAASVAKRSISSNRSFMRRDACSASRGAPLTRSNG